MWGGAWILASLEGGWWCRDQKGESSVCLSFFFFCLSLSLYFSLSTYLFYLYVSLFPLCFPCFFHFLMSLFLSRFLSLYSLSLFLSISLLILSLDLFFFLSLFVFFCLSFFFSFFFVSLSQVCQLSIPYVCMYICIYTHLHGFPFCPSHLMFSPIVFFLCLFFPLFCRYTMNVCIHIDASDVFL